MLLLDSCFTALESHLVLLDIYHKTLFRLAIICLPNSVLLPKWCFAHMSQSTLVTDDSRMRRSIDILDRAQFYTRDRGRCLITIDESGSEKYLTVQFLRKVLKKYIFSKCNIVHSVSQNWFNRFN